MELELTTVINRPPDEVFAFFRDVDQHAGQKGSLVPVYDKITPGPAVAGTRCREVVRLLPGLTGEIRSELVGLEPDRRLAYRFVALGMAGDLTYRFAPVPGGTRLIQRQSLRPAGLRRLVSPLIKATFSRLIRWRLAGIKRLLEGAALPPTP